MLKETQRPHQSGGPEAPGRGMAVLAAPRPSRPPRRPGSCPLVGVGPSRRRLLTGGPDTLLFLPFSALCAMYFLCWGCGFLCLCTPYDSSIHWRRPGGDARFIPINKGIAVNAEFILEFKNGCCIMESGARFPVRVRDSARAEQMASDYHFEKIRSRQRHRRGE